MPDDEKDLVWLNIKIDQLNEINDKKISELGEKITATDHNHNIRIEKFENHLHHDLKLKGDQNYDEIRDIYKELSELEVAIKDIGPRLKELEKKVKLCISQAPILSFCQKDIERIEKLEKDLYYLKERYLGFGKRYREGKIKQDKELSELKINIDTIKNKANDNEGFIANDKIDINELKERVEGIYKSIHGIGDSELVIRTVEEEWERDQAIAKHWQQRIRNLKNGGDSTRIGEMTHEEGAKYELDHPDEFDEKPPKHKDCMNCDNQGIQYSNVCQKCSDFSYWKPKEKPPESKGKILICPNCMRQYEFKHREYKIVEKADLEKLFKYLDLGNLYDPTIRKLEEKYLTEEAEKKDE